MANKFHIASVLINFGIWAVLKIRSWEYLSQMSPRTLYITVASSAHEALCFPQAISVPVSHSSLE